MTTYMPEAEFNVTYCKSVPLISAATIKQAFQQASSVPFSPIVGDQGDQRSPGVPAPVVGALVMRDVAALFF